MSIFPERKSLSNLVKSVQLDDLDFDVEINLTEEQKVYTWVRIYINEEINIEKNSDIEILYSPTGEKISVKFICYNKSSSNKNEEDINKYSDEEDKKILCCMVDTNLLNKNSEHIPFLRSLFKSSYFHQQQIYRREDMVLTYSETKIEYYHIDF